MLEHAGHFLPEWGDEFAEAALRSIEAQIDDKRAAAIAEAESPAGGEVAPSVDASGDGASA